MRLHYNDEEARMAFARKTYKTSRTLAARIWSAFVLVFGFLAIVFLSSARLSLPLAKVDKFAQMGTNGIARADAPGVGSCGSSDGGGCMADGCAAGSDAGY